MCTQTHSPSRRAWLWLALVLAVVLIGSGVEVLSHYHTSLPACGGALLLGLGGHFVFDLASYLAVFVFGVNLHRWVPTGRPKSVSEPPTKSMPVRGWRTSCARALRDFQARDPHFHSRGL